jgi:BirA family biotin operon repressor/biotin-[acetyl-CoA-carboxylase] ligase
MVAMDLAARGAPEGTTVVARSQTSGKGRFGRTWISPAGGLYMSFVLRPKSLTQPELVTLISAVAIVRGVKETSGLEPTIRWPNDVMIGRKKLAGVIALAQSHGGELDPVVVGIGVNCNTPLSQMHALSEEATTIANESGGTQDIAGLRDSILDSFSGLYDGWKAGADALKIWSAHLGTLGKQISVKLKTDETPFSCTARGVDGDGSLVVAKGRETTVIRMEDLDWLREGSYQFDNRRGISKERFSHRTPFYRRFERTL